MAITKPSFAVNNVQGLADLVQDQSTAVKQTFDKASSDIKAYLEDQCDEIDAKFIDAEGVGRTTETIKGNADNIATNLASIGTLTTADGQNVKLTGDQTVAGVKTFSSSPIVPTAVSDTQAVNKGQMDSVIEGVILGDITPLLDTDGTLSGNSDTKISTQKAVKTYVDTKTSTLYTATNVSNDYSITAGISAYADGQTFKVKVNADSTGNTTLNCDSLGAISILKANGTNVTNLKTDGVYTVVYSNGNFILQGEGASGNATASDLLSGKTATTDAGEITGTMTDRPTGDYACDTSSVSGTTLKLSVPDSGYYGDSANITITDADFIPANILSGKNVFGVVGTLGSVKSIQRGTIQPWSNNTNLAFYASISSVNMNNSIVLLNYYPSYSAHCEATRVHLEPGFDAYTQIGFTRNSSKSTASDNPNTIYEWVVIEFEGVNSKQTGTVIGANPGTITVSSVNTSKSIVVHSQTASKPDDSGFNYMSRLTLTDPTTISMEAYNFATIHWQLLEFK